MVGKDEGAAVLLGIPVDFTLANALAHPLPFSIFPFPLIK
jgi:hypothetical protein